MATGNPDGYTNMLQMNLPHHNATFCNLHTKCKEVQWSDIPGEKIAHDIYNIEPVKEYHASFPFKNVRGFPTKE